jgi:hypothetical protein
VGTRINLSPNPSLKTTTVGNATDWTSSPAGYARQSGLTGMDHSTGYGGSGAIDVVTSPRFAAVAGQSYVASVQVKTGASNTFKILINWYSGSPASGTFLSNTATTSFTVNGVARCEIGPFTAPTGAGAGYMRIIEVDSTTASFGSMLIEQTGSTGRTYFDGDSNGATWAGTSGNSISYLITATDAWAWSESGSMTSVAPGPVGGDSAHWAESATGVATGTIADTITWAESAMVVGMAYDDRRGRVRVSAFGLPAAAIRAQVNRRLSGVGRYVPVRGGKTAISGGTFTRIVDDYEFPAGAAVDYQIVALSSPDGAPNVIVATAFATQAAITPDVWLKFIAIPSLNHKIILTGWSDVARTSRNARYDVLARQDPIVVTDVHSSRSLSITVRTTDITDGEALDHALSAGAPAFLHTPVDLALPSMYVAIGDHRWTKPSTYSHVRLWTIDLVEVTPPPPSVFGPATTCQSILDTYATCQEVLDAFDTCAELAS